MNNLDDMKALWHTAKTDQLPSSKEMLNLISKFRRQKLRNKWMVIVGALLISCLEIFTLFIVPFKLTTTYIGAGLVVIATLLLAATNIKSLKRFYQLDDHDNLSFLEFLAKTRENQIRHYQRNMFLIMPLSATGCLLYLYELVYHFPIWGIVIYLIMTVYLGIVWFVVRPRTFKRDQEKLNATRERVENILNQLK